MFKGHEVIVRKDTTFGTRYAMQVLPASEAIGDGRFEVKVYGNVEGGKMVVQFAPTEDEIRALRDHLTTLLGE